MSSAIVSSAALNCLQRPSDDDHNAFFDKHEHVTFVGRPFPLEEAPDHFARLRRWGLTFSTFVPFVWLYRGITSFSKVPCYVGSIRA